MKKILLLSIFFLFFTKPAFPEQNKSLKTLVGCEGEKNETFLTNQESIPIKLIEVDTKNYRKWTVNGIRILTSRFRYVDEKYKKRFDAKISVTYENNVKCNFHARIRHSGDEKDHISLLDNSITQSLDIHLVNGNIRGITKFKLLRPKVRGILEDEIFLTEILRHLKFIAPRTIKINARVNKVRTTMLFQEKAAKEMLEFNNRREGPIFEGDERFFFNKVDKLEDNQKSGWSIGVVDLMNQNAKFMLAKQVNSSIASKSEGLKSMSLDSTAKLNLIYLYFASRFQDEINKFNYMEYDLDNNLMALFNENKTLRLDLYNLLIQAVNGHHGLAINNRKFFWNSFENYFEPINYDSNANIASGIALGSVRLPISNQFLKAFPLLKKDIGNLNLEILERNLRLSGLYMEKKDIKKKIGQIIDNINQLKKNYEKIDLKTIQHNRFEVNKDIISNYKNNLKKSDLDLVLVKFNSGDKKFKKCENFLENCEFIDITNSNISNLLEGSLSISDKSYQYLGKNIDFNELSNNKFKKTTTFDSTDIFYDEGIEVKIDEINKEINILQTIPGAKIIFLGGQLNETKINYKGILINKNDEKTMNFLLDRYPNDINGLTGCVTFSNLILNNVSISADESSCEDTVNLINVSGYLNEISIKNAFSDGLDVDFSNLKINNVKVISAGNDCVDFSAGKYFLINAILENCGDKAVSIGEKSTAEISNIYAKRSDTGIASKDSSITVIEKNKFENLNTCISVYNKKQEFDGGIVKLKNLNCVNYKKETNLDKKSKIVYQ